KIDEVSAQDQFAAPHLVEHAFNVVKKKRNALVSEHRGGTLDRVERPKDAVDKPAIVPGLLHFQNGCLQIVEQLKRLFFENRCVCSALPRHPSTFFTTPRSCSCLNGLIIQPVAP